MFPLLNFKCFSGKWWYREWPWTWYSSGNKPGLSNSRYLVDLRLMFQANLPSCVWLRYNSTRVIKELKLMLNDVNGGIIWMKVHSNFCKRRGGLRLFALPYPRLSLSYEPSGQVVMWRSLRCAMLDFLQGMLHPVLGCGCMWSACDGVLYTEDSLIVCFRICSAAV